MGTAQFESRRMWTMASFMDVRRRVIQNYKMSEEDENNKWHTQGVPGARSARVGSTHWKKGRHKMSFRSVFWFIMQAEFKNKADCCLSSDRPTDRTRKGRAARLFCLARCLSVLSYARRTHFETAYYILQGNNGDRQTTFFTLQHLHATSQLYRRRLNVDWDVK